MRVSGGNTVIRVPVVFNEILRSKAYKLMLKSLLVKVCCQSGIQAFNREGLMLHCLK